MFEFGWIKANTIYLIIIYLINLIPRVSILMFQLSLLRCMRLSLVMLQLLKVRPTKLSQSYFLTIFYSFGALSPKTLSGYL
jgi:hypothetical protein